MKKVAILISCTIIIFSGAYFLQSCGKCECLPVTPDPCSNLSFKFSTDILPIFTATCTIFPGCHAVGSTNRGGPLTNYTQIFNKRADIQIQVKTGTMPQAPFTITAEEKQKIDCWINSGAPNN